ncbi:MAG: hypothetical protein WBC63_00800 [Candidatus Bipolaricaulia bacterium]
MLVVVLATFIGSAGVSQGFVRSIGLRVVLPWTGLPFLIGAEATTELAFGLGFASFFLTTDGRVLFTIGADVRLTETESRAVTYLRLTTGLFYFDPIAFSPKLLGGVGLAYEFHVLEPILFSFAAEFLYPLALPIPMFSTSAGWLLP